MRRARDEGGGQIDFICVFCTCAADFGLAKQKDREFSVLKSTVGTILYWW